MLGFIAGIIAGFLAPHAEAPMARPVAQMLDRHIGLEPGEMRVLAFILVMLIAGVAASLLNSGTAFWVILGGALGYFGTRIVAAVRSQIEARRS